MILIVSYADEDHTLAVMPHLVARRQRFTLFDLASLPAQASLTANWSVESPSQFHYAWNGRDVDLNEIRVGWWRRVWPAEGVAAIQWLHQQMPHLKFLKSVLVDARQQMLISTWHRMNDRTTTSRSPAYVAEQLSEATRSSKCE